MKIIGWLFIIFGVLDFTSYNVFKFDIWGDFFGIYLPDLLMHWSAYIEGMVGIVLLRLSAGKKDIIRTTAAEVVKDIALDAVKGAADGRNSQLEAAEESDVGGATQDASEEGGSLAEKSENTEVEDAELNAKEVPELAVTELSTSAVSKIAVSQKLSINPKVVIVLIAFAFLCLIPVILMSERSSNYIDENKPEKKLSGISSYYSSVNDNNDETLWAEVLKEPTWSSVDNYLKLYPNGQHADLAREALDAKQPDDGTAFVSYEEGGVPISDCLQTEELTAFFETGETNSPASFNVILSGLSFSGNEIDPSYRVRVVGSDDSYFARGFANEISEKRAKYVAEELKRRVDGLSVEVLYTGSLEAERLGEKEKKNPLFRKVFVVYCKRVAS